MGENRSIVLGGFHFELTGFFSEDGTTVMTLSVTGKGESPADLRGWVCEICPGDEQAFLDVGILSCEKRRHGTWMPAVAQKTTYELIGDVGINGVIINDWVGRYEDDPEVEYRIVLDTVLEPKPFKIGLMHSETVLVSEEKIHLESKPETRVWVTPIEKSFCLFIVVPEGYKPVGACKACVSATKRLAHIVHQKNEDENGKLQKASLMGSIRIVASLPLKSKQACGDEVHAATCDCFEVCETIGYADEGESFNISEIAVCPQSTSLDLTLLNAHCGKSVYRLDGKYTIGCRKNCE